MYNTFKRKQANNYIYKFINTKTLGFGAVLWDIKRQNMDAEIILFGKFLVTLAGIMYVVLFDKTS